MKTADIKVGEWYWVQGGQRPSFPMPGSTYERWQVVEVDAPRRVQRGSFFDTAKAKGIRVRQEGVHEDREMVVPPAHVRDRWENVELRWPGIVEQAKVQRELGTRRDAWHEQIFAALKERGMRAHRGTAGAININTGDLAQLLRELGADIGPEPQYLEVREELREEGALA